MEKTVLSQTIRNLMICISAGTALAACGGGSSQSSGSTQLLADGEACAAAWASGTAYNGGTKVSRSGRNYTSAFWTQGQDPATNNGPAGSGQPWTTGYLCGSTPTPTPTPTPAPTPTPTPAPTPTPTPAPTPTPTPAPTPSCTYSTWASGTNYPLGTVVKYPANGNFYKEVNSGTNGSDGTDPTISTWYWAATTCSSSSPTPTPTPTPTGSGFGSLVSQAQFDTMFPPSGRNSFYTYAGLVAAANSIAGFTTTGSATVQKQEAAAFLANVAHETGRLLYVVEQNTANYGSYCDMSQSYGCPAGTAAYYGRGPLQLSWNFNYKAAGDYLGINLLSNPNLVATDATVTWKSALWYWMTQNGPASVSSMNAHNGIVNGYGFGQTIKSINGDIECVGGAHYAGSSYMQDRVNYYNSFTSILGVSAGSNLGC